MILYQISLDISYAWYAISQSSTITLDLYILLEFEPQILNHIEEKNMATIFIPFFLFLYSHMI